MKSYQVCTPTATVSVYFATVSSSSAPLRIASMDSNAKNAEFVATSTPVEKIGSTNRCASPTSIHPGPATAASRSVDHKARVQVLLPAVGHFCPYPDGTVPLKQHLGHAHTLNHFGAELMGVSQQHRVQHITLDVVGVRLFSRGKGELS